jgi:hypothetical protein
MPSCGRPACRGIAAVALTAATAAAATGISGADTPVAGAPSMLLSCYTATAGLCPVLTGSNDVVIGGAGIGRVVFNFFVDREHRQLPVP